MNVYYANFGKSPAISMRGRGRIFWGINALEVGYQWLDKQGTQPFTVDDKTRHKVLPPWVPTTAAGADYETLYSDYAPTAEQLADVMSHDDQVVVVDRTQYYDTAGNFYWTDFCLAQLATGAMEYCAKHNEIH